MHPLLPRSSVTPTPMWQRQADEAQALDKRLSDAQIIKFGTGPNSPFYNEQQKRDGLWRSAFAGYAEEVGYGSGNTNAIDWNHPEGAASQLLGDVRGAVAGEVGGTTFPSFASTRFNPDAFSRNFELTPQDHQTYGAGKGYGFHT